MPPKDKMPIKEKNSREKEKRQRKGKKAKRYSLPKIGDTIHISYFFPDFF